MSTKKKSSKGVPGKKPEEKDCDSTPAAEKAGQSPKSKKLAQSYNNFIAIPLV